MSPAQKGRSPACGKNERNDVFLGVFHIGCIQSAKRGVVSSTRRSKESFPEKVTAEMILEIGIFLASAGGFGVRGERGLHEQRTK